MHNGKLQLARSLTCIVEEGNGHHSGGDADSGEATFRMFGIIRGIAEFEGVFRDVRLCVWGGGGG